MTTQIKWDKDQLARLLMLNQTHSIVEIAADFGCSSETIRMKLKALHVKPLHVQRKLGVREDRVKPPKECYSGRFDDHPSADRDRHMGRRPMAGRSFSGMGCSAAMCADA